MSISVKQRLAIVGAGLVVAVLAAACPGELENAECFSPDSCCDVPGTIIAQSCAKANCHDNVTKYAGLDLTNDPGLNARILNVPSTTAKCGPALLVDQANPDASSIFTSVDQGASNSCTAMPFTAAKLPSADIRCIRQWVGEVAGEQPTGAAAGSTAAGTTTM